MTPTSSQARRGRGGAKTFAGQALLAEHVLHMEDPGLLVMPLMIVWAFVMMALLIAASTSIVLVGPEAVEIGAGRKGRRIQYASVIAAEACDLGVLLLLADGERVELRTCAAKQAVDSQRDIMLQCIREAMAQSGAATRAGACPTPRRSSTFPRDN